MARPHDIVDLSELAVPGSTFAVRVMPGAARDGVAVAKGQIRVRVSAPPEDGKATDAARELLAAALGVAKTRLTLLKGTTSRNKVFQLK